MCPEYLLMDVPGNRKGLGMESSLKLFSTRHIPWIGKPYAFVVIEPKDTFGGMFTETFVFWTNLQQQQPIPLDGIRFIYGRDVLAFKDPLGNPAVDEASALAQAKEWARGAIDTVVLHVYEGINPRPAFPRDELEEIPLHHIMHLWGTGNAHNELIAICARSKSASAIAFVNAVRKMPTIDVHNPLD